MKYKYDLIRSERKSITVIITDDNKITVRCPWSMRMDAIEKYLKSKEQWIEKVVYNNSCRLALNDDVIELRQIYFKGKKLPLVFCEKNEVCTDKICVKSVADIEKLYTDYFSDSFYAKVDDFARMTKLTPQSVSIKGYKGRWGCCDSQNNLTFNYILFMLTENMQNYVIVHELCHTLCHNHSPAFWKLVSKYIPDYAEIRRGMKEFSFLVNIY